MQEWYTFFFSNIDTIPIGWPTLSLLPWYDTCHCKRNFCKIGIVFFNWLVRGLRTEEKTRLIAHGVVIMYAFDKCQFFEAGCAAIRMRTRHSPFSDKLLKLVKTFCATYVEFVLFFWLVGGFSFFGNGPMYYIIERLKFKLLISVRDFPSNKAVEDDVKRAISSYLLSKWWICKYLCIYIYET